MGLPPDTTEPSTLAVPAAGSAGAGWQAEAVSSAAPLAENLGRQMSPGRLQNKHWSFLLP